MATSEKAQAVLEQLATKFETPDMLTECMARTLVRWKEGDVRPIDSWPWSNRMLAAFAGTQDGRTFNAWREVGRYVTKGAKAFYILAPNVYKAKAKDDKGRVKLDENGKEITTTKLGGFRCQPEFRVEDTEGAPLPTYEPEAMPPLMGVAEAWGLKVKWESTLGDRMYGWFDRKQEEIVLLSYDEAVFFHELVHAADDRNHPKESVGQDPVRETIAEVGSAVLCKMYGLDNDRNAFEYVTAYTGDAAQALIRMMPRIEQALNEILEQARVPALV
ncbi:ArdC family protein [Candidatus Dependentiae bacterium]|nr:ArdC family protein [Candidatus Dependentiae bacterium]